LLSIEIKPMERLDYRSSVAAIGRYRCSPANPLFRDSGPSSTHSIVFARSVTAIEPERAMPFVEGPDVVTFFNRGDPYRQRRISPEGARCDWFVFDDEILFDAILRRDPDAATRPARPFVATHARSTDALYLRQRAIVDAVRRGRMRGLDADEALLRLLEEILDEVLGVVPRRRRPGASTRGPALVDGAKAILAETYRGRLELTEVAAELNVSLSYLCRLFRHRTGMSMSDYRRILRLRTALESLRDRDVDLGSLAERLGFASHSHFSLLFRRAFGVAPSRWRDAPSPSLARGSGPPSIP